VCVCERERGCVWDGGGLAVLAVSCVCMCNDTKSFFTNNISIFMQRTFYGNRVW